MKSQTLLIVAIMAYIFAGCVSMPEITPDGKVDPEKTVHVPIWKAGEYAEKMLETKGWKKPKQSSQKQEWLWIVLAGACGIGSIAAFVGWYLTHMHKLSIVAIILGISAVVCTAISQTVGRWWFVPLVLLPVLTWIGWKLRHYSVSRKTTK